MDTGLYSQETMDKFMNENLFFKDKLLKKYYEEDKFSEFRKRLTEKHSKESLESMVYVYVTDMVRYIIYEIVGKLTAHLKSSGNLILTGGDAVNYHLPFDDRVVTSDIDTKFVPRFKVDKQFFGKLQAVKLLLWDKLGDISMKYGSKIYNRLKNNNKLARYLGISFASKGPYVTRRYTLKQKKKASKTSKPSQEDVLIDVEIFALDLKINYFSPEKNKVENFNLGGILDIALMRPSEFGYEVVETINKTIARSVAVYKDNKGKLVSNPNIVVAKKRFLIDDIYLMKSLGLRPHKKAKDTERMRKLLKTYPKFKTITKNNTISVLYSLYQRSPIAKEKTPLRSIRTNGKVSIIKASQINPKKYVKYTTKPSAEKLKKLIYASQEKKKGYKETQSNMRFDLNTNKWVKNTRNAYVKNEYKYRFSNGNQSIVIPKEPELYGYKNSRNNWAPKKLYLKSALIPFIGLKK